MIYAAAWVLALAHVGNLIGTNVACLYLYLLDKTRTNPDQGVSP